MNLSLEEGAALPGSFFEYSPSALWYPTKFSFIVNVSSLLNDFLCEMSLI